MAGHAQSSFKHEIAAFIGLLLSAKSRPILNIITKSLSYGSQNKDPLLKDLGFSFLYRAGGSSRFNFF